MRAGVTAALAMLALVGLPAGLAHGAASEAATAHDAPLDFDIPAQPLASALERYGSIARQPALYRSDIVSGQMSAPLHGRYTPEAALRGLLEGTGLSIEAFEQGTQRGFVLSRPAHPSVAPGAAAGQGAIEDNGYPGLIQTRVWQALCANPATQPGGYRSLLRFDVDAAGKVRRPRLLSSTGNARRDAAVLDVLGRLQVSRGASPQSVTMLLLPHAEGFARQCGDRARQGGAF